MTEQQTDKVIDTDNIRGSAATAPGVWDAPALESQEVDPDFQKLTSGAGNSEAGNDTAPGDNSAGKNDEKPLTKEEKAAAAALAEHIIGAGVAFAIDKAGSNCGVTEQQISATAKPLAEVLEKYRITEVAQISAKWGAEIKAAGAIGWLAFNMWTAYKKEQHGITSKGKEHGDQREQSLAA